MDKQITIDYIDCIDDLFSDYSLYFDALCQEDTKQNVIKVIEDNSKGYR